MARDHSTSWSKTVTQRCTANELAFGNDETGSATGGVDVGGWMSGVDKARGSKEGRGGHFGGNRS